LEREPGPSNQGSIDAEGERLPAVQRHLVPINEFASKTRPMSSTKMARWRP
jgi:hypothetical protein